MEDKQRALDELMHTVDSLRLQVEELKSEKKDSQEAERSLVKQLSDDLRAATKDNSALAYKMREQSVLIKDLHRDFQEAQKQLEQANHLLIKREDQVADLEQHVVRLTAQLAQSL